MFPKQLRNRPTWMVVVGVFSILISFLDSSNADDLKTPAAYLVPSQISAVGATPAPGNPFGFRLGLSDYFNEGTSNVNLFEHGFAGVDTANQTYPWTGYVGPIPARAYLPPCASPSDSPCIESVSSKNVGSTEWVSGTLASTQAIDSYGTRCSWCVSSAFDPFLSVPFDKSKQYGGIPYMWTLPNAPHGGGSDYRVDVQLNQKSAFDRAKQCGKDPCTLIQIIPLKLGPSQSFGEVGKTALVDYRQFEFPKDTEFKIVLRMAGGGLLQPDGFFFGRVENLNVSASSDNFSRLTISGKPVRVPFAQLGGIPIASIPDKLMNDFDPNLRSTWHCLSDSVDKCVVSDVWLYQNTSLFQDFPAWERLGIKALGSGTMWEVRGTNLPSAGTCTQVLADQALAGTLSTNSTAYSSDVPYWDYASQSFVFSVFSPHLDENGVINRGYYQLSLPSKTVNCLWGKDASAANALVQIVSEDGTSQVATTDVHVQDGTFYFTAANFEYSNPELRVSFNTSANVAPSPTSKLTPTPSPTPAVTSGVGTTVRTVKPTAKRTITCVKGKVVKKVTGTKPACPTGYKRK